MISLDMRAEDAGWQAIPDLEATCLAALNAGAKTAGTEGEVSLLLTSDQEIQTLNRSWRDKDKPTDVLSFPAATEDRPFLGDIALAYGVCTADAETRGILMPQHLSHLLIHGYLHLIGHDHIDDTQASQMEALEIAALALLGWPDPYK